MPAPVLSKYVQPEVLNQVAHLSFRPRQLVEGNLAGAHKSPRHGFAVEFASHREYVPGDDIKHLDWNVYYRRDKLFIKQYEMETNLTCHLVLDMSASMRYGQGETQKQLYASRLAATLGYLVVQQQDKIALSLFDERIRAVLPPSTAMAQILRLTNLLEHIKPEKKTNMGRVLLELAEQAGRRGIVVILSDFFMNLDELEPALQRLRFDRHEVVLMQIVHHDELTFELPGMVRFVGLEVDEQHLTRPEDIKESYLENFRGFNERLEQISEGNRCERILCDTSRPMSELFADYLQQRSLRRRRW